MKSYQYLYPIALTQWFLNFNIFLAYFDQFLEKLESRLHRKTGYGESKHMLTVI